jgi:type IV secretion system protein VirB10
VSFWDRLKSNRTREAEQSVGAAPTEVDPSDTESFHQQSATTTVAGERGVASIHGTRSLQARVSSLLAGGLTGLLALGFLTWYYTQTFSRQSRAAAASESKAKQQAQGEMMLPPLGRVDPPLAERVLGPPPEPPVASTFATEHFPRTEAVPYAPATAYSSVPAPTPQQFANQRRLSGPVFVSASNDSTQPVGARSGEVTYQGDHTRQTSGVASASGVASDESALAGLLEPTATPAAHAKVLPTQRLLLPKGAFLDCTLETAIDSSLPGMTTCVTATDTFSADGSVVLLERGTKLVGETRGDVRHGTARVYVLWTEARTPTGVVVPLASPGTDELGRAGLPGEVNRHFWERFGAAILVSVIDGAVQATAQRSSRGEGAVIVNPSTSRDVMTEVLRSTINIPPTVTKPHGDRIAVLVARDLDFRSVYELRSVAAAR